MQRSACSFLDRESDATVRFALLCPLPIAITVQSSSTRAVKSYRITANFVPTTHVQHSVKISNQMSLYFSFRWRIFTCVEGRASLCEIAVPRVTCPCQRLLSVKESTNLQYLVFSPSSATHHHHSCSCTRLSRSFSTYHMLTLSLFIPIYFSVLFFALSLCCIWESFHCCRRCGRQVP